MKRYAMIVFLTYLAALAFVPLPLAAPLVIDTCPSYVITGATLTCAATNPGQCPPGQVGLPPNCTTPPPSTCPPGQTGTPPNCTTPPPEQCPPGQVGTPPNCTTPPPTGDLSNCTSHGLSVIGNAVKDLSFTTASGGQSGTGFGDNVAWVFRLTVPAGTAPTSRSGMFQVAEYASQATPRHLVISKTPCDFFRPMDAYGNTGPINKSVNGSTAQTNFLVGPVASPADFGKMQVGETYYFSVRNWSEFPLPGGSYSCGAAGGCQATYNYQVTSNSTALSATKAAVKKPTKKKPTKK